MGTGTEAEWTAFLASSWPGLVRTATLLAGDPDAAQGLAARALLRVRRDRRLPGADAASSWEASARRALLALPAEPGARVRARLRRPRPAAAPGPDPLLERYRALRPRQRALLVLTVADRTDVAAAAEVLGIPPPQAARELLTALDELRGAGGSDVVELDLTDPGPATDSAAADASLAADPVVGDLQETFTRLAAAAPRDADLPGQADQALVTARRSRRRAAVLAACVSVAVVTTTAGVVGGNARAEAERQRVAQERAAYAAAHPTVLSADLSTWPTRGSRARDPQLLADVRARLGARVDVVFAGDVVGVDAVVALTGPGEAPLLHVIAGAPHSPVDAWREAAAALAVGVGGVPAVSAAVPDDRGRLHLLAVTLTSGITVSYSPAPLIADDATVSRRYLRLPLTDGVGTALVAASADRLRTRVDGTGFEAIFAPLTVPGPAPAAETGLAAPLPLTSARSCDGSAALDDVPGLVREATRDAGLAPGDVTGVRLLWCREDAGEGEAALALAARRGPDIQCYEAVGRNDEGARTTSSQCWPVPRGTGASAPFLAPDVALGSGPSEVLDLTVHAPGATTAEVVSGPQGSRPLARARVAADGYARLTVPPPRGAAADVESQGTVVLLDGRGEADAVLPVRSRHLFDVWGDGADGPVTDR